MDLTKRTVWITAKEIIPVLFIVMIGVLLFFGQKGNRESQARIFTEIVQSREAQYKGFAELKELLTRNNGGVKDLLHDQEAHLTQQTDAFLARLKDLADMIIIHEFNDGRPQGERLPVTLPPELMPKR